MSHYIDIEKAEEDFINFRCDGCECYPDGCDNCLIHEGAEFFINYDESDVQPVVHAEWIETECDDEDKNDGFKFQVVCSHCYNPNRYPTFNSSDEVIEWTYQRTRYCPFCGAKMKMSDRI